MPNLAAAVLLHQHMLALYALYQETTAEEEKSRKYWVHPINDSRDTLGVHHNLVRELRTFPQKHHEFFRMSKASFDQILAIIGPHITKEDTVMRKSIRPDLKLSLTLHKLATNADFGTLHKYFRVGKSTATGIVYNVCDAIWKQMAPNHMVLPTTIDQWKTIAEGFSEAWNFPTCLGAIDGKHIVIQKPQGAGSQYFNYKKAHSICLMAIVDSRYRFLMVDVGQYGSESDGGVWDRCDFNIKLQSGEVCLPDQKVMEGGRQLSYCFVADEAFPLKSYLMRPYPGRDAQTIPKRVFNYRLSRARRVVENAFAKILN